MNEDKRGGYVRAFECSIHGWFVEEDPRGPEGLYNACPECPDEWCRTQNLTVNELRQNVKIWKERETPHHSNIITAEEALERIGNND